MSREIARSVTKNTAVMMGSQAVTWISSFILMMFLPRYLGSEAYGRMFLAMSVTSIFQIFIEFGGHYYITKFVARDKNATPFIFVHSIALRFILWLISLVLTLGFAYLAGYPSAVNMLLFIFTVSKLWEEITNVVHRCFQGHEMMKYAAVGNITERAFLMIAGVSALMLGASVVTIGVIMSVATLLNFIACSRFIPKIIPSFPSVSLAEVRKLAIESVPYFLWSLFGVVYYRIDAVMLSFMAPESVVGWYGAAYRFFDIVMFLPSIVNTAIYPVFSRLWSDKSDSLARTVQKSLDFIILAGIPISIGGALFADRIVWLFYGVKEFGPTIVLLQIFFAGILLVYINFILMPLIFASDKQRRSSVIAFLAMLLNPLLNLFMIPYFQSRHGNGGIGASFATLITECFLLVCSVIALPKSMFSFMNLGVIVKGLVAAAAMTGSIFLLRDVNAPWTFQMIVAAIVYPAALLLLKAVGKDELYLIAQVLPFWKPKQIAPIPTD